MGSRPHDDATALGPVHRHRLRRALSCQAPDVVRVVDPATGEIQASVDHPRRIVDQRYDPSGAWLLVTYVDGTLAWFGSGGSGTIAEGIVDADW